MNTIQLNKFTGSFFLIGFGWVIWQVFTFVHWIQTPSTPQAIRTSLPPETQDNSLLAASLIAIGIVAAFYAFIHWRSKQPWWPKKKEGEKLTKKIPIPDSPAEEVDLIDLEIEDSEAELIKHIEMDWSNRMGGQDLADLINSTPMYKKLHTLIVNKYQYDLNLPEFDLLLKALKNNKVLKGKLMNFRKAWTGSDLARTRDHFAPRGQFVKIKEDAN